MVNGCKKVIIRFFTYLSGIANQTLTVCGQTLASDRHQAGGQEDRSGSTLLNTTLVSPTSSLSPSPRLNSAGCTLSLSEEDIELVAYQASLPSLSLPAPSHNSSGRPKELVPHLWRPPLSTPIMVNGLGSLSGPAAFLIHHSPRIPPQVVVFFHHVFNFQIGDKISINST